MLDEWKEFIFYVVGVPFKGAFETVIQAQFLVDWYWYQLQN